MKRFLVKIPCMISLFLNLCSFVLLIVALILSAIDPPVEQGVSRAFGLWVFSVIDAMASVILYIVDWALLSKKAKANKPTVFDTIFNLVVWGSLPMVVIIGGRLGISILIWNLYYLALLILEIISFAKYLKATEIKPLPDEE